jgi:hypothetical protein
MSNYLHQGLLLTTLTAASGLAYAVEPLGTQLGIEMGAVLGTPLPVGIGGIAVVTAISLIVGVQLVKRRDK